MAESLEGIAPGIYSAGIESDKWAYIVNDDGTMQVYRWDQGPSSTRSVGKGSDAWDAIIGQIKDGTLAGTKDAADERPVELAELTDSLVAAPKADEPMKEEAEEPKSFESRAMESVSGSADKAVDYLGDAADRALAKAAPERDEKTAELMDMLGKGSGNASKVNLKTGEDERKKAAEAGERDFKSRQLNKAMDDLNEMEVTSVSLKEDEGPGRVRRALDNNMAGFSNAASGIKNLFMKAADKALPDVPERTEEEEELMKRLGR